MICCDEYINFGCFFICDEPITNPAIIADFTGNWTLEYKRGQTTYTVIVPAVEDDPFILPNVFGVGVNYFTLTNPDGRNTYCYKISIQRTEANCPTLINDNKTPDSCTGNVCSINATQIDIIDSQFVFTVTVNISTHYRIAVLDIDGVVVFSTAWQTVGTIVVDIFDILLPDTTIELQAGNSDGDVCASQILDFSFALLDNDILSLNLADELTLTTCDGGIQNRELFILLNTTGSATAITGNNVTFSPEPVNASALWLAQTCNNVYTSIYLLSFNL